LSAGSKPTSPVEAEPVVPFARRAVPYKPHAYNKKAIKFLIEHAAAALFQDPGMGKTAETLAAIKFMIKRGLVSKVLLIAPLRVCHLVWPKEVEKWLDFKGLRLVVLHGKDKDELLQTDADIYVVNPEGLDWLLATTKTKTTKGKTSVTVDLRRFKALGFDTLVIDELSKFKHTNTNRFKALKQVIGTFGRRWGLTGSPAANGLLDLFGQCYLLDQGRSLGPYITYYRAKYFEVVDKQGFVWRVKKGAEEEIYKRVAPLALRMAAEDYLELPQLVENVVKLDLPPDVRKLYDELEEELIVGIEDRTVLAKNAAVASGKCRQLANGGIYLTPELEVTGFKLPRSKREWVNLHTVKVDAVADLVDELQGSPLLLAYEYEHDLDRLRIKFGQDLPYLGGGVNTARAKELERLWNRGELPLLAAQPQAIAHGLNLQEVGCHVAWHSLTWDYELYDQFIRRVLRQGNQAARVFVHLFVMRGTVDEAMRHATHRKERGQQAFFDALKALGKNRRQGMYFDAD
jgi:SNF2 family DNA or RNA helicase